MNNKCWSINIACSPESSSEVTHQWQKKRHFKSKDCLLFIFFKKRSLLGWVSCLQDICCLVSTRAFPLYLQRTVTHCLIVLCTSHGDSVLVRELTLKHSRIRISVWGQRQNKYRQSQVWSTLKTALCIVTALCRPIGFQKRKPVYNLRIYSSIRRQKAKLDKTSKSILGNLGFNLIKMISRKKKKFVIVVCYSWLSLISFVLLLWNRINRVVFQ